MKIKSGELKNKCINKQINGRHANMNAVKYEVLNNCHGHSKEKICI